LTLKLLLKRGALLAAANWPAVAIQFVAETTFQLLLAVPLVGASILVAVLVGADLGELLQGSARDIALRVAGALASEPTALICFGIAFAIALAAGSVLMFLVKGGTLDVLLAAHESAGDIERQPITIETVAPAACFTLPRFTRGCTRLFRSYVGLGIALTVAHALSGGVYLAFVLYGYRAAAGVLDVFGWTIIAAVAAVVIIVWITLVNCVYLLLQIAMAADSLGFADACRAVGRFIRADFRQLTRMFLIILGLVVGATLVSALAWSGVGLIAFVPLVGLAVIPLQIAALIVRGLAFEYIGLAAAGAYLTLYRREPRILARPRAAVIVQPLGSSGTGTAAG
jgi:hypothetical protein